MKTYLDKLGSFGSVVTAAACPACFPQLAALGTALGLGALAGYEGQIFLATKILVALAMVGHVLAFFNHRVVWMLVLGVGGGLAFFLGMYVFGSEAVIYLGLLAMLGASTADVLRRMRIRRRVKLRLNAQ
jgi:mercuric ion transport protein